MIKKINNLLRPKNHGSESDHIKTIATGSLVATISSGISMVVALVTIPLLLKAIGDTQYGLYVVLVSTVGLLGVLELGILTTIRNMIGKLHSENKYNQIYKTVSGVVTFFVIISVAVLLVGAGIWMWSDVGLRIIGVGQYGSFAFVTLLILTITWFVNSLGNGLLKSLHQGLNILPRYHAVSLVYNIIMGVSYIVFLLSSPSLIQIVLFLFLFAIIKAIMMYISLRAIRNSPLFGFGFKYLKNVKHLLAYSPTLIILGGLAIVIAKTNMIIASHYVSLALITGYAIAHKLFNTLAGAIPIPETSFPNMLELAQQNNTSVLRSLYKRVIRINILIRFIVSGIIAVYAFPIINVWVGAESFPGTPVILGLFVMFMIFSWTAPHVQLANALGLYKKSIIPMVTYAAITVPLYFILIPKIGIVGIPIAIVAGNLIGNGLILPMIIKKSLPIQPLQELFRTLPRMIIPGIVFMVVAIFHMFITESIALTIVLAAANSLLFATLTLLIGLDKNEKSFIIQRIKRTLHAI
ncbi:MAG: hypothetical protein OEX08_02385 [Candidatus Nomurabacteria bacterium]|nr:hypothetical protein [Candidatus Nomurabacteria bacterium]